MKYLIIIFLLNLLIISCGSGMIGLLQDDPKTGYRIMDHEIFTMDNGCAYVIEVYGYYETGYICGSDEIIGNDQEQIIVEKLCNNWEEPIILEESSYPGFVSSVIHDAYLDLVCNEEL